MTCAFSLFAPLAGIILAGSRRLPRWQVGWARPVPRPTRACATVRPGAAHRSGFAAQCDNAAPAATSLGCDCRSQMGALRRCAPAARGAPRACTLAVTRRGGLRARSAGGRGSLSFPRRSGQPQKRAPASLTHARGSTGCAPRRPRCRRAARAAGERAWAAYALTQHAVPTASQAEPWFSPHMLPTSSARAYRARARWPTQWTTSWTQVC